MVSATFIINVGSDVGLVTLGGGGGNSALPVCIHVRLRGGSGNVCSEQNHSPNLKCMLIVSYIDNSGPDRTIVILEETSNGNSQNDFPWDLL